MLDSFVRTYGDLSYRFPVLVNHGGMVLGFAMDDSRRIYYSVLDLAHASSDLDSAAWSANPARLDFPTEIAPVGFAAVRSDCPARGQCPVEHTGQCCRPVPVQHRPADRGRSVLGRLRRPLRVRLPAGNHRPVTRPAFCRPGHAR